MAEAYEESNIERWIQTCRHTLDIGAGAKKSVVEFNSIFDHKCQCLLKEGNAITNVLIKSLTIKGK
jgi:hypothetical protein